ncbi:MAG: ATP-binding protein [Erysipelotrichaceae bacterium]|nr:ATP-binding protein [Erysipelotrichaceae bacterium]
MQDLAMYIIEIMMNSIHADSHHILCHIEINKQTKELIFIVEDDGKGMDKELLAKITDPFVTSRKTRKIGLGVALLQSLCDQCEGKLIVKSYPHIGTITIASLPYDHWDVPPLGDIGEMMMFCIQADPTIEYVLRYIKDDHDFFFDTKIIKGELEDMDIADPSILLWIKEYINQGIKGEI